MYLYSMYMNVNVEILVVFYHSLFLNIIAENVLSTFLDLLNILLISLRNPRLVQILIISIEWEHLIEKLDNDSIFITL